MLLCFRKALKEAGHSLSVIWKVGFKPLSNNLSKMVV